MQIITLTSDWGSKDHYIASVKGKLLSKIPDVIIVDISHDIRSFDINHAAFVLKNAFTAFPRGTLHIIGINTIAGINSPHTAVKYEDHFFIAADNGVLSLLCSNGAQEIYEIDIPSETDYFTFPSRDTFPIIAAHIISGKPLKDIGEKKEELTGMIQFEPIVDNDQIRGKVIHVDGYGNAITNIPEKVFKDFVKGRSFVISYKAEADGIKKIIDSYDAVPEGERLALFSSTGYLQIAVNKGKASELLGLRFDEGVLITRG